MLRSALISYPVVLSVKFKIMSVILHYGNKHCSLQYSLYNHPVYIDKEFIQCNYSPSLYWIRIIALKCWSQILLVLFLALGKATLHSYVVELVILPC